MELNYIKHKIANIVSINKIVTIHYHELDRNFFFEGESHNFWEMVYVDAGEVEIIANGKHFHLKQGEMIFHKPNEFHTLKAAGRAANVFVITFVCSSEAMSFFKGKTITAPAKIKRNISGIIEEYTETFNIMKSDDTELIMKENPPIGGQQMIRIHLEELLILLIRNEQDKRKTKLFPSKESLENYLATQMINIIDENIYNKITVEQICEKLNYSRTYLAKIFKSSTGHTVLEYILMSKIREAKKLIREEKYNFTQISDTLAFDNPHYFSAVFKRITGITPSEYKNSVIKP